MKINWRIGWPQVIWFLLVGIDLGINLAKDGEPKEYSYSFGVSFIAWMITFALLAWGGFFTKPKLPEKGNDSE